MPTKEVAVSTLWQIASQCVMAILSIITVKFVAMGLSQELAGIYNSAYGYLQLFGILADFGLYAVAIRELSRPKDQAVILGNLLILRILILLVVLGSAILFVWIIPSWKNSPLPPSVTIAALVPLFTLLAGIFRTVFQIHYRMHFVFVAEVLQRIITVTLIGGIVLLGIRGTDNLMVLYYFLFIGGIGAFVLLAISLLCSLPILRPRLVWDYPALLHILKRAAPFGIAYLCIALYRQFDTTLIALLRSDFAIQNAHYGFVVRMTEMAFLIPTLLLNSVLPILPNGIPQPPLPGPLPSGEGKQGILERTFVAILILGTISFLFSFLWSRPLMQLLTTNAYLSTPEAPGSDSALQILAITMPLNGIILFAFYILLAHHIAKPLMKTFACGALLSLILNIILIPHIGFIGVSLTSVIVHTLLAIHLYTVATTVARIHLPKEFFRSWGVFSLLLFGILSLARPLLTSEIPTVIGLILCSGLMGLFFVGTGLHRTLQR